MFLFQGQIRTSCSSPATTEFYHPTQISIQEYNSNEKGNHTQKACKVYTLMSISHDCLWAAPSMK